MASPLVLALIPLLKPVIERMSRGTVAVGVTAAAASPELLDLIPMPHALLLVPLLMGAAKGLRARFPDNKWVKLIPF